MGVWASRVERARGLAKEIEEVMRCQETEAQKRKKIEVKVSQVRVSKEAIEGAGEWVGGGGEWLGIYSEGMTKVYKMGSFENGLAPL